MSDANEDKPIRLRRWTIRKPSNLPSAVLLGMAEMKRITSFLKLLTHVDRYALAIYNNVRTSQNITTVKKLTDLGVASVYFACTKYKLDFTDKQFEEAAQMSIEKIKGIVDKIDPALIEHILMPKESDYAQKSPKYFRLRK